MTRTNPIRAISLSIAVAAFIALPHPTHAAKTIEIEAPSFVVTPDRYAASIVRVVDSAKRTIDIAAHKLGGPNLLKAIREAAKRGVMIRAMLEKYPSGGGRSGRAIERDLAGSGIFLKWGNPEFRCMRENAIVVDGSSAFVSTLDLTEKALEGERGFVGRVLDPREVMEIARIFAADWNRSRAKPVSRKLAWAPDFVRNSAFEVVNGARHTLDIYAGSIADDYIVRLIARAADRGVIVRMLVGEQNRAASLPSVTRLRARGIRVRIMKKPPLSANAIIADAGRKAARALLGSIDLTALELDECRGLAAEISDPERLSRLSSTFDKDYAGALSD